MHDVVGDIHTLHRGLRVPRTNANGKSKLARVVILAKEQEKEKNVALVLILMLSQKSVNRERCRLI